MRQPAKIPFHPLFLSMYKGIKAAIATKGLMRSMGPSGEKILAKNIPMMIPVNPGIPKIGIRTFKASEIRTWITSKERGPSRTVITKYNAPSIAAMAMNLDDSMVSR